MNQPVAQLRLSSPADLVDAVPFLLGFHPQDSLVALAMRGPRRRLVFTMRLDLPEAGEDLPRLAAELTECLVRAGAEHVALVVVTDAEPLPRRLSAAELVGAAAQALAGAGIDLAEAVLAGRDRWWSYLCRDQACCPAQGTPISADGSSRVAATAVYAGLVALPSRSALEDSLEPDGPVTPELRAALRAARAVQRRVADPASAEALQAESLGLLQAAVDTELPLSEGAVARLITALADPAVRDACCAWSQTPRNDRARRLWTQLARRTYPPHDAAALCLVAWFAYLDGDATLAAMAVRRCLRSSRGHRLALLLEEALAAAVDPALFREQLAANGA